MKYPIEFKRKAIKDLKAIPSHDRENILSRIEKMGNDLTGDVKKLTQYTPEYRMRCGQWRVLFEIEKGKIVIYRITHRRESYR